MKRNPLAALLDSSRLPDGLVLLFFSVFIGGSTGFAAVFFIRLIALIQSRSYKSIELLFPHLGVWSYVLVPMGGALLAGPIIAWFAREAKGHGVPEVMQALVLHGGRIRPRVAVAKIIASALCIGTGGSAGREGPIIQVGSALGSMTGQVFNLSDARIKNLVCCGAAAGIAATFNAPIAGVAFAIEVLMSEIQVRTFGNVVIAAVSASVVSQILLGDHPAFTVPAYTMQSPWSLILFLLLGLASAVIGVMFIRMLGWFEITFDNWKFPLSLKPVVGAMLLGLLGTLYLFLPGIGFSSAKEFQLGMPLIENIPHVFGSGFTFIEEALHGRVSFLLLALLVFLKPLATSFTLGSGNSGGVFAPSLFVGAMLGGAMGHLFNLWLPEYAGPVGSYALVGMAAVFAATARAPLTAMLIVFEMSNDYSMILPLMVAAVTASYLAQTLYADSIYTFKLTRRNIRFSEGQDLDIMQSVQVDEVMKTEPITICEDEPLAVLYRRFQETNLLGFPVVNKEGALTGIVTLQDLEQVLTHDTLSLRTLTVDDIAVGNIVTVYPDEPIWTAIQKMAPRDLARLPVISRDGKGVLKGLVSRSEILRAYDVGIIRKQRGRLLNDQAVLRQAAYNDFSEFRLKENSAAIGCKLRNLSLPQMINVVSYERDGIVHIPKGDTVFAASDIIMIFGRIKVLEETQQIFQKPEARQQRTE